MLPDSNFGDSRFEFRNRKKGLEMVRELFKQAMMGTVWLLSKIIIILPK